MLYKDIIEKNKAWIEETFNKLDEKLSKVAIRSRDKVPYTTINGVHDDMTKVDPARWTNGFWGGLMWLMYSETKKDEYLLTAKNSEKLLDFSFTDFDGIHHDVGFMWHIVSGASYRLTGDKLSRTRNLVAAMMLAARYNIKGEFIRSWNANYGNQSTAGFTIIDCLMNIPILYWAAKETGDDRFRYIAEKQADLSVRDHLRMDGTVNHIVVHDTKKANTVLEIKGGQGYSKDSCWSRGLSWAVYGFVLSYIHTGNKNYFNAAKKAANVFIRETEKTNWLPRCDFMQPEKPDKWDSTAGAIASCGLIEIAKNCGEKEQEKYLNAAINILSSMEREWCDWSLNTDSVLQMGLEAYGVKDHKNIIYGDFYFVEAILKLKGSDFLIW